MREQCTNAANSVRLPSEARFRSPAVFIANGCEKKCPHFRYTDEWCDFLNVLHIPRKTILAHCLSRVLDLTSKILKIRITERL